MSSHLKVFKLSVVALIAGVIGVLLFSNVTFDRKSGIRLQGSTELSWELPAEHEDIGVPGDLAGYTIHCWNASARQTKTIVIEDPAVTTYALDNLWPGDYQCALSATLNDGSQSALSNVVARSIQ